MSDDYENYDNYNKYIKYKNKWKDIKKEKKKIRYPSLNTYPEKLIYPDIEWWRATRAIFGKQGMDIQYSLINNTYQTLNNHFGRDGLQQIAILYTFYRSNGKMNYGLRIHEQITRILLGSDIPSQIKNFIETCDSSYIKDKLIRRVAIACQKCLNLIKKGEIQPRDPDVVAVIPLITFYNGFVINFARAAGFNNIHPKKNASHKIVSFIHSKKIEN